MAVHIQTATTCPYCGELVVYHCKSEEEARVKECRFINTTVDTFEPKYWEAGDDHDDATRKLIDEAVGEALKEYLSGGTINIDYRKGGSPIIYFDVMDAPVECQFKRDLGDVLFSRLQDDDPSVLHDLIKQLFEVYERWRKARTEADPNCNIPVPALVDDEAPERE